MVFGTDLTGKTAVITGAGGVLCSMFAKTLAEAGAAVALLDVNLEGAQKIAEEICAEGGRALAYEADVLDKALLESVHARVLSEMGPVTFLSTEPEATRPAPILQKNTLRWEILRLM